MRMVSKVSAETKPSGIWGMVSMLKVPVSKAKRMGEKAQTKMVSLGVNGFRESLN